MDWLRSLQPSTRYLILTGAGLSASCLAYSLYRYKFSSKSDILPPVESFTYGNKSLLDDSCNGQQLSEATKAKGVESELPGPDLSIPKDEYSEVGWVTPTASNDNLTWRLVENGEEIFEVDSPRETTAVESDFIMDDDFEVDRKASRKILILGLERSGKSALLSQLSKEGTDCSTYIPTKGFNVVCISFDKVDLNIWEVGGAVEYRSYWKNFCQSTDLILFAVDSCDPASFPQAKKYFNEIIGEANEQSDFHIIATKSDMEGSISAEEIQKALGLDGMKINVVKVAVRTGGADYSIGLDEVQKCCLQMEE